MSFIPINGRRSMPNIDDMIAALKSKGVPILWVGVPAIRGLQLADQIQFPL